MRFPDRIISLGKTRAQIVYDGRTIHLRKVGCVWQDRAGNLYVIPALFENSTN